MRVLIACEYSGIVREAFTKRGHYAMSCDLLQTEKPFGGPHYKGPAEDVIDNGWDLMIAHPPCTILPRPVRVGFILNDLNRPKPYFL